MLNAIRPSMSFQPRTAFHISMKQSGAEYFIIMAAAAAIPTIEYRCPLAAIAIGARGPVFGWP
jgi:hypothetical protein